MSPSKPRFIVSDLLLEHFEELEYLYAVRRVASRSADYQCAEVAALDRRIKAHLRGLLVSRSHCTSLAAKQIQEDDANLTFAAAMVLLYLCDHEATALVLDEFAVAEGSRLEVLQEALIECSPAGVQSRLNAMLASADPVVASHAAEVLAVNRRLNTGIERLTEFFQSKDPVVRRAAWRLAALAEHQ